jgi:hypothetical protein
MTNFLDAFEAYFRPEDDRFALCLTEEQIPPECAIALKRLYKLSFSPLTAAVYFVVVMCVEGNAEFVGSAGLAILTTIICRQASFLPRGRALGHASHMRNVMQMFLSLTAGKGFAIMYSTYDTCKMPTEALGELECSHLRWATTAVIAIFGHSTYVASLVFSRLAESYLLVHSAMEKEKV